jgi:hypothetical protein
VIRRGNVSAQPRTEAPSIAAVLKCVRERSSWPWIWLYTEKFSRLELKEADRVMFGRKLREALGPEVYPRWNDPETDEFSGPLGRYCKQVTEEQRIRWMTSPEQRNELLTQSIEEVITLAPAIDRVLAKVRKG